MICPKCGSQNVNIQAVTETKTKKKSLVYWLLGGWIVDLLMFLGLTLFWLIVKIFRPKKITSKTYKMAICQNCGYSWKVK